jgi:hypoxanthine phosphoribosyltransferase
VTLRPLFSEEQIAARVNEMADAIASNDQRPTLAAPILAGAFVFAADLLRALAKRGVAMPVEFLWLRSYAHTRTQAESISVLVPPGSSVQGKHVLLIDGVLDSGRTLERAIRLLTEAGAQRITTAVAVDKRRCDCFLRADHAAFTDVNRFIVGYGMDDAGLGRGLPYIAAAD